MAAQTPNLSNVWFKLTDLEIASGSGSWVTTTTGEKYLDFAAGIAVISTGHSHPKVVEAIATQAARGIHLQANIFTCLLYTSPSPRDRQKSRMPSSA